MKKRTYKVEGKEQELIIGDLNEFREKQIAPLIPTIKRIFEEEKIIAPDKPEHSWKLLSKVIDRYFNKDIFEIDIDDFRSVSMELEKELRETIRENKAEIEEEATEFYKRTADPLLLKWKEEGELTQEQKNSCVDEISREKDIIKEDAFDMAISFGIDFGNMNQFGSWKKNRTRLNNSKKVDK